MFQTFLRNSLHPQMVRSYKLDPSTNLWSLLSKLSGFIERLSKNLDVIALTNIKR